MLGERFTKQGNNLEDPTQYPKYLQQNIPIIHQKPTPISSITTANNNNLSQPWGIDGIDQIISLGFSSDQGLLIFNNFSYTAFPDPHLPLFL